MKLKMQIKSLKKSVLALLMAALFISVSCGDDDEGPKGGDLPTTPEAVSEHDTKSGGIYKGILVGSTGTIKIILQKDKKVIEVTFDDVSKTLTTNSLNSWASGQAISDAVFTNGNWKVTLSINADGTNPDVDVEIPGHTVSAVIIKETSNQLVEAFLGSYSGSGKHPTTGAGFSLGGYFNFSVKNNSLQGLCTTQDDDKLGLSGSVSNGKVSGSLSNGVSYTGSVGNNSMSGTWKGKASIPVIEVDDNGKEVEVYIPVDINGTFSAGREL